jgi:hypothetical protein
MRDKLVNLTIWGGFIIVLLVVVAFATGYQSILLMILGFLIRVLVIPSILLTVFGLSYKFAYSSSETAEQRVSKMMAFYLGLGIFTLVVILNLSAKLFVPTEPVRMFAGAFGYVIVGSVIGLLLMALVHSLVKTRAISLFVAILASTSLSTLYLYAFWKELRDPITLLSVSLLVGALIYIVLFPDVLRSIFQTGDHARL